MKLYLIRHARLLVPEGVCYGRTDLPVDADHQQQVRASLLHALPRRVPVFCSPLERCRMLADDLARELDAGEAMHDARLVEMDFGTWEMRPWEAIPRNEIDAWAADLERYRPGGGECLLDVAQRVRAFHESLRSANLATAIIIGHAGTIRLMLSGMHGNSLEDMVAHAALHPNCIAYGALTTIDC